MLTAVAKALDARYLRLAARIDSPGPDRFLPWGVAVVLFGVMAAMSIARARMLDGGVDLAIWLQAVAAVADGDPPRSSLLGGNVLAEQLALAVYPIGVVSRWVDPLRLLLTLQAGALAAGVVPIWRLARDVHRLRVSAGLTLMLCYSLYPPLHNVNLGDFHSEALALPLLLWAAWAGMTNRRWMVALCLAGVVACRLDLALAVAGVGALFWWSGRRRLGIVTLVAGLAYGVFGLIVVQQAFAADGFAHAEAFGAYGTAPPEIAWNMLTSPGQVLGDVLAEDNFAQVLLLFAPVIFTPILSPRVLLAILPLQTLYLIAEVPEGADTSHQLVAATVFIFYAAMGALGRLGREGVERIHINPRIMGAIALASAVFFVAEAEASPYRSPWAWGGRDRADQDRLMAVAHVEESYGPNAAVRAGSSTLTELAERPNLHVFDPVQWPLVGEIEDEVQVLVIDRFEAQWSSEEQDWLAEVLRTEKFQLAESFGGVEVHQRVEVGDGASAGADGLSTSGQQG